MNAMEKISTNYTALTKTERETCDIVLNNPIVIVRNPISEAAQIYKVSPSSILRMAKKIGYKGYSEFRYSLEDYLNKSQTKTCDKRKNSKINQIIDSHITAFGTFKQADFDNDLKALVKVIKEKPVLKTIGIGNSSLPASQLIYSLYMNHKYGEMLGDDTKIMHYSSFDCHDAVIIIFTVSANPNSYLSYIKKFKRNGATVAIITANQDSNLLSLCDFKFVLPTVPFIVNDNDIKSYVDTRSLFYIFSVIISCYYSLQI